MKRRTFLCASVVSAFEISAAFADGTEIHEELRRYLHAIRFGEIFQGGIRKANTSTGRSSEFLDRILSASPAEIEATVAPAFAPYVTLEQAREMADFFESPLGQKVLAEGIERIDDPAHGHSFSASEVLEVEKFAKTRAGSIARHLTADPGVRQEYFKLLQQRFKSSAK